jgi:predicted kinase
MSMGEPFLTFMERELEDDLVIITCGLPATNKTEIAEVIAENKGYALLRTDLIRTEILKGEDIFDEKTAADMEKRTRVYDLMFRRAEKLASKAKGMILDATFITRSLRERAAALASRHSRSLLILQTFCPEAYSLKKISLRSRERYESNALTKQAYYNNKQKFEPVDSADLKRTFPSLRLFHVIVDTGSDSEKEWLVISSAKW